MRPPRHRHRWFPLALAAVTVAPLATAETGIELGRPFEISSEFKAGDRYMGATMGGALVLSSESLNGVAAEELSGIVWDEDADLMYAVSDTGGLLHLKLEFDGDRLTGARLVDATPLRTEDGTPYPEKLSDAEGLAIEGGDNGIAGDTRLFVSFEQVPRIAEHRPDGSFVAHVELPSRLANADNYAKPNQQLEALTLHPEYGLLTSPQVPLKDATRSLLQIYDLTDRAWQIEPVDPRNSAIVGLDTLPNGDLVVLERRYASFFQPVIFRVRALTLRDTDGPLATREIVTFDSSQGFRIDNFEGIARHKANRWLLVSDDNRNFVQKTLLVYLDFDPPPPASGTDDATGRSEAPASGE